MKPLWFGVTEETFDSSDLLPSQLGSQRLYRVSLEINELPSQQRLAMALKGEVLGVVFCFFFLSLFGHSLLDFQSTAFLFQRKCSPSLATSPKGRLSAVVYLQESFPDWKLMPSGRQDPLPEPLRDFRRLAFPGRKGWGPDSEGMLMSHSSVTFCVKGRLIPGNSLYLLCSKFKLVAPYQIRKEALLRVKVGKIRELNFLLLLIVGYQHCHYFIF